MSFATVELLDKHLLTRSYVTGYALSEDDKKAFSALKAFPIRASTPNAFRWALHISALTGLQLAGGAPSSASAAPAAKAGGKPAAKKDEDDMDLFGDDDVNSDGENAEEAAATKARRERMEAARKLKEEADAKKGAKAPKEKPAEKSLIVLDVKPWEADTDLEAVWKEIIKKEQDGLRWGDTFKLEPVAYGIKKLVMTVTIEDAKVLLDDITEHIEGLEDHVQSCTVASMNKV